MVAGTAGKLFVPNGMMNDTAAVFFYGAGEPIRRIAEPAAQFKNPPCADHSRYQVAQVPAGRTDDGKMFFVSYPFHTEAFLGALRNQRRCIFVDFPIGGHCWVAMRMMRFFQFFVFHDTWISSALIVGKRLI